MGINYFSSHTILYLTQDTKKLGVLKDLESYLQLISNINRVESSQVPLIVDEGSLSELEALCEKAPLPPIFLRMDRLDLNVLRDMVSKIALAGVIHDGMSPKEVLQLVKEKSENLDFEIHDTEEEDRGGSKFSSIQSLEDQIIQTEKMATIGRLVGDMAHQLHQPLTEIRSLCQKWVDWCEKSVTTRPPVTASPLDERRGEVPTRSFSDLHRPEAYFPYVGGKRRGRQQSLSPRGEPLQKSKENPPRFSSDLQEVEKAAKRCQQITKSLLDFSKGERELESLSLNHIIQTTLSLLRPVLNPFDYRLELNASEDTVRGQPDLLRQVILNIVHNACQASKDGDPLYVRVYEAEGHSLCFEVQDFGVGIADTSRIFDPFFTTKGEGQGTGLGLSLSQNIIASFNGKIHVDSVVGEGTTFRVIFPLWKGK